MQKYTVARITAAAAHGTAVTYPVADFVTPFTRGRDCVLVVNPDSAFAAGDITVETDNASSGAFSNVFTPDNADAGETLFHNITLGDNIRITCASRTAGECEIFLLGDS